MRLGVLTWLMMVSMTLTTAAGQAEAADEANRQTVRALVLVGGHDFDRDAFPAIFAADPALETRIVDVTEAKRHPFETIENWDYDAVVMYNFRQSLSDKQRTHFEKLLKQGVGLAVLHHGISAYVEWEGFADIVGGRFVRREGTFRGQEVQPSQFQHHVDIPMEVVDPDHPITQGVPRELTLHDETYNHVWMSPDNHVLLRTDHPTADGPQAWTRRHAGTRVFYLMPGQGPESFQRKEYQTLVTQGIRWVSEGNS